MRHRKLTGIVLAAALLATILGGCQKSDNTGSEPAQATNTSTASEAPSESADVRKEVGISVMFASGVPLEDLRENTVGKALFEKTGVYFTKETIADSGASADLTKMQLAFASGDLPDVVVFSANQPAQFEMYQKLIKEGQIIDLKPYVNDSTPNLKKLMDRPEILRKLQTNVAADPVYFMPIGYPESNKDMGYFEPGMTIWAREDWLQLVGVDPASVQSADDLYNLLKAFKEKVPQVNNKPIIPTTLGENGSWWNELSKPLAAPWFSYLDAKIMTQHLEPAYVDQIGWLAKIFSEGLLDREAYTHKYDVFAEKVTTGRVGVITSGVNDVITKWNPELQKSVPGAKFVPLTSIPDLRQRGTDGTAEAGVLYGTPQLQGFTVITRAAKDPEAIIKFLDYIASDEGQLLVNLGTQGILWEEIDGKPSLKKEIYDLWTGEGKKTIIAQHGLSDFATAIKYNLAGNDKHFELTGGDSWSWQLIDKNTDEYKFKAMIVKEIREGPDPDPTGFVTTMAEFGEMANAVYGPITPIQNKALVAKSEEDGRKFAQQLQETAIELKMQDFLDTATTKYNEARQQMEQGK